MKKLLTLALAFLMILALVACGTTPPAVDEQPKSDAPTNSVKIGVSIPTLREERWGLDKEGFEKAAKELGVEVLIQVADNDAGKQQSQCENLISQGIGALIIASADSGASANIAEMAHAAGIPVIAYDRPIEQSELVDIYVTITQYRIGQLMGDFVVANVAKGNIVVLAGDPGDATCVPLKQGAMDAIKAKVDSGDYKIVMEQDCIDWEPKNAQKHAENALTANNNDIAAFIAPNDGTAGGIIEALAAQGLAGKVIVTGQDAEEDALTRIKEGTQSMTVGFDCAEMSATALKAALQLIKGEAVTGITGVENNGKIDVPTIGLVPYALTKDKL